MGLARTGSISGNGSGDLFLAFSTATRIASTEGITDLKMLGNDSINPLFEATVQATEEAIVNAMVAADTMTGIDGHRVIGLPHEQLIRALEKYNRISR
jgi:L-aminopeptidase/D-esterase-like protein